MKENIRQIEEHLLLDAIFQRYGYDFRNYSKEPLKRQLEHCLLVFQQKNLSELIPKLLHDKYFFHSLLLELLISVTEMFRDPLFFLEFKRKVVGLLKTYPFIKIWHAGCATGQEVYSMAILLEEAGLLEKSTIYATDINMNALKSAQEGIYPLKEMERYGENYLAAGGEFHLAKYYSSKYGYAKMHDSIKKKIVFFPHNIVSDEDSNMFSKVHGVICRNVFIYFDKTFQEKSLCLFYRSLVSGGFLCLGSAESIDYSEIGCKFEAISRQEKIFKKRPIL